MPRNLTSSAFMKPFVILALPGMYLFYKYNQYKQQQQEQSRRKVTERELAHLNHKIVSLKFAVFQVLLETICICEGVISCLDFFNIVHVHCVFINIFQKKKHKLCKTIKIKNIISVSH